jgi:hypothetical protein
LASLSPFSVFVLSIHLGIQEGQLIGNMFTSRDTENCPKGKEQQKLRTDHLPGNNDFILTKIAPLK